MELFIKLAVFIGSILVGSFISRKFLSGKSKLFYSLPVFIIGIALFNLDKRSVQIQFCYIIIFGIALGLNSNSDGYNRIKDKISKLFMKQQ